VAKQPDRSSIINKAVTGFRLRVNKDQVIRARGRTTQLLADHPHNVADETKERDRKSDENGSSSSGECIGTQHEND
jgi:hypothetical protein